MRAHILHSLWLTAATSTLIACSSNSTGSGFNNPVVDSGTTTIPDATQTTDSTMGVPPPPKGDSGMFGMQTNDGGLPDGSVIVNTTIYANTDDTLYSMDPMTQAVTPIGLFAGTSDASNDSTLTDCAVNAAGEVYVNSESDLYKVVMPATPGPTAIVQLTKVATISSDSGSTRFYALAFAPAGVLGSGEMLVGGDGNGELWSIDPVTGATQDLGNFGPDKNTADPTGSIYALSGDLVFYLDAMNAPTGLATIRSCKKGTTTCIKTSDFLAGIDMTALTTAYTSKVPATSLLKGIYGGSMTSAGPGTGFGDLFGLGAWQGTVYAFSRAVKTPAAPARLITIDTTSGVGTALPAAFAFTNGWSGAGVTTKVTINIPKPPPPPQ